MSESLKDSPHLTFVENFSLSGIAAIVSKTIAAPIERLKLNIQNQDEMIKQGRLDKRYSGIIDCCGRVVKDEGVVALWRGNGANVLRYFPTQALNFAFLGSVREYFGTKKEDGFSTKLAKNTVSGGVAGSLSLLFVYSLDYARTRLANDTKSSKKSGGSRQFNGLIDCYKKTFASDGIAGLYRGFLVSCFGVFIYRGLYFGLYDTIKPLIATRNQFSIAFAVAYLVTVVSGLVSYPIDTIRRRMMMTSGSGVNYKNSFECASKILSEEGIQSFFKGAGANILRGLAGALVISGFDSMRNIYIREIKQKR